MANIKLIKRRIKSAQNISQITKAMEMVAASKMKKAQNTALIGKPYADKINSAVRILAAKLENNKHPLLKSGNQKGAKLFIVISTNKGLCGGLNTNLFRYLTAILNTGDKMEFISLGKKGSNFLARSNFNLIADFSENLPVISNVPALTGLLVEGFISGRYSQVILVYNNFISALKQEPIDNKILPIENLEKAQSEETALFNEFLLEPNAKIVLESLLPHYLENQIRTAIFEAEASEHSARMIAMKNATDAALDLIDDLTLVYNKARQEKITYEIADIVTARLAVE